MTERRLRVTALVLAVLGIGVGTYLTYVHYAGLQPFCAGGSHGCERVQSSSYAKVGGIPVAVLGLAGYLVIRPRCCCGASKLASPRRGAR